MKLKLILLAFLGILLYSCSIESQEDPLDVYRTIAYTALSTAQKASLAGDYKEAEVAAWTNGNYLVVFITKQGSPGPIRVVVDPVNGSVVEILP
jgi:hypothetical protein